MKWFTTSGVESETNGASRSPRAAGATIAAACAALVLATACVPTAPPPEVRDRPDGTGASGTVDPAPSPGCADPAVPYSGGVLTVATDSGPRQALLRLPEGHADASEWNAPMPLLLSLHPFTSSASDWEQYSGLAEAAAGRGYAVLSPTGSQPGPRWAVPGGLDTGVDDLAFLDALVREAERVLCTDRNRVFAAGFSAGAAMSQALSCTMPWRFAAVAGSGGVNLTDTCPDSAPTDVLVLHGTADPVAPTSGSEVVFAPPLGLPVLEVVRTDAARAGCDPVPSEATPAPGVAASVYTGCDAAVLGPERTHRVEYWRMLGAGHTWAGSTPFPFDAFVGPTASGFSATEVVLDFFDRT